MYDRLGTLKTYTGAIPPAETPAIADIAVALGALNEMAGEVPLAAPWKAPRAREWDGQTLETWKLANMTTEEGRLLLDLGVEAVFAGEPRDVSLLHVLFYIHSAGSFDNLINTAGGAQESRFVGGSQLVSRRVAKALGSRVVLSSPVRRIDQRRRHVVVESDRVQVTARYCVVTAPPALAGRIEYHPALPGRRDQLTQRMPMGSVLKCHALYDKPFWRDDGRTGQATSDTGPVKVTYDNSPPTGGKGVLLGFIEGEEARVWSRRSAGQAQGRGAGPVRPLVRQRGALAAVLHRAELDGGGVEPRLLRRLGAPRRAARLRRGAHGAGGPHPLGRHRDRHGVVRVHGRRGALRRARGRRAAQAPLARGTSPRSARSFCGSTSTRPQPL